MSGSVCGHTVLVSHSDYGTRVEAYHQTMASRKETTSESTLLSDDAAVKKVLETLELLRGPAREAAFMKIAERVKLKIVGEQYSMQRLIRDAIAAKALPEVHLVIRDECIRLGVGRREYRAVVVPLFNRIQDAIGWKDKKEITFCPKWERMKRMVHLEYKNGPNKALHVATPDWKNCDEGCVWTEVDVYLAERLIAYRNELPSTYRTHLQTIATRVTMVEEMCPGIGFVFIAFTFNIHDHKHKCIINLRYGSCYQGANRPSGRDKTHARSDGGWGADLS